MIILGYEIIKTLHESDNSVIYRAKRLDGAAIVVLKVPRGEHPSPQRLARFRRAFDGPAELPMNLSYLPCP